MVEAQRHGKKIEHWAASTHTVPSLSLCGSLLRPRLSGKTESWGWRYCRTYVQHTAMQACGAMKSMSRCTLPALQKPSHSPMRGIFGSETSKDKTFCWTHRVIASSQILGLRKWARLTGHGPASELLNTGPELVQGAGYNEAVDWWALGCVLFELCSRKQLFPGKAHEVFSAIVIFDPSSPNSFSGCHCRDAVRLLKCLCAAKPLKSDPRGRNQAARLVWRFWMAAGKARQREISVPDLVSKAYYNCSCFFSSLLPKCFCTVRRQFRVTWQLPTRRQSF